MAAAAPRSGADVAGIDSRADADADGSFVSKRLQPDGTVVAEFSTAPVTRPDGADGKERKRIEVAVKPKSGKFPLAAEDAVRPIRFGTSADALVELGLDRGPVTLQAKTLNPGIPTSSGGLVTYADAGPATDLEYRVVAEGLKEDIVLKSAAAPTSHVFRLADPAGQLGDARRDADGGVTFTGPIGDLQLRIPAPVAYERKQPRAPEAKEGDPEPLPGAALAAPTPGLDTPGERSAELTVVRAGDGFDVTVAVRQDWLAGKQFPVVLDPALVFSGANGTISDATGGINPSNDLNYGLVAHTDTRVGPQHEQNFFWRSYLKFNVDAIPQYSTVDSATFHWDREWGRGDSPRPMELRAITGYWDYSSGARSIDSSTEATASSTGTPDTRDWDVKALAQRWVDRSVANQGFAMRMNPEVMGDSYTHGFYGYYASRSTNAPNDSFRPRLTITYRTGSAPGVPTNINVSPDSNRLDVRACTEIT